MFRPTLVVLAFLIVLGSGVAQGLWSGRWVSARDLEEARQRLERVPERVGDWEMEEEREVSAKEQQIAGIVGYKSRLYVNRQTGQAVSVLLVCGRPGAIAVHTPDVCFEGAGYRRMDEPARQIFALAERSVPGQFWRARFTRYEAGVPLRLQAYWGWNAGGGAWVAADNPRWEFLGRTVLYKLYASRVLTGEEGEADTCVGFLRQFLPALHEVLFAEPPAAKERP